LVRRRSHEGGIPPVYSERRAAHTGLFVIYTDTRGLYDLYPTPQRTDRSFVVKFSRMFDVLSLID
jgi:hypothetical protein